MSEGLSAWNDDGVVPPPNPLAGPVLNVGSASPAALEIVAAGPKTCCTSDVSGAPALTCARRSPVNSAFGCPSGRVGARNAGGSELRPGRS